jgi:hypothetical protein
MTATLVTQQELTDTLGIGSLYSSTTVENICQAAEDLVVGQLWFNSYPIVGAGLVNNVAYVVLSNRNTYTTGQSIQITNCGIYNGTHTITATWPYSTASTAGFPWFMFQPFNQFTFPREYSIIQFSQTHADDVYHQIQPYGKMSVDYDTQFATYNTKQAIRLAALEIAVDMWQSRSQSSNGGISPDFSPSPYRMGYSVLRRISGLIAPYVSPRSLVG